MVTNIKVDLPTELKNNLEFVRTIPSSNDEELALLVMAEDKRNEKGDELRVLRFFRIRKVETEFEIVNEVESFVFANHDNALEFLDFLPKMSAIDLLTRLSGEPVEFEKE